MSADVFHLHTWLWLPAPRERVFAFFSDAENLERITPAFLNFHVRTPAPIAMASGTRIDYRLHLHGIPLRWRSEISDNRRSIASRRASALAWVSIMFPPPAGAGRALDPRA